VTTILHAGLSLAKKQACTRKGMEGQPKGLAPRNPAKPGFRHEVPEMRPYYLKNFYKFKTAGTGNGKFVAPFTPATALAYLTKAGQGVS
jgi:hypothetical protein